MSLLGNGLLYLGHCVRKRSLFLAAMVCVGGPGDAATCGTGHHPPCCCSPGWLQQCAGVKLRCRSYPVCVSLSLLLAACFPKGSGCCRGVFGPTCALQEVLPANQAEDQLMTDTFGANK